MTVEVECRDLRERVHEFPGLPVVSVFVANCFCGAELEFHGLPERIKSYIRAEGRVEKAWDTQAEGEKS